MNRVSRIKLYRYQAQFLLDLIEEAGGDEKNKVDRVARLTAQLRTALDGDSDSIEVDVYYKDFLNIQRFEVAMCHHDADRIYGEITKLMKEQAKYTL